MSASATNCANYKVKPILNTSAPTGSFGTNKYLIPFQIYTFNNQGSGNLPAINGSNGGSPVAKPQDSLIGNANIFTLSSSSTGGDYTYTLDSSDSRWSWISSMTVQWIANDAANNEEDWRIVINAQSNFNGGVAGRGVTILFRFGNGTEYGTVFPLYVAQNELNDNPQESISCLPSWQQ
jgi:hypothetical protein